jgi:hypothetical protein
VEKRPNVNIGTVNHLLRCVRGVKIGRGQHSKVGQIVKWCLSLRRPALLSTPIYQQQLDDILKDRKRLACPLIVRQRRASTMA